MEAMHRARSGKRAQVFQLPYSLPKSLLVHQTRSSPKTVLLVFMEASSHRDD